MHSGHVAVAVPSSSPCDGTSPPSTLGEMLASTLAYDTATREHAYRVRGYAIALAHALGVDDQALSDIEDAALLHDIGKLAIPRYILNKPSRLTAAEHDDMKRHVEIGAQMLSNLALQPEVVLLVRCHHENWDGNGYPRRLGGETIPLGARIIAVADCFDALTSDRPYRRGLPRSQATQMVFDGRGSAYDPSVVDVFMQLHGTGKQS